MILSRLLQIKRPLAKGKAMLWRKIVASLFFGVMLAGCATSQQVNPSDSADDPLEAVNRSVYQFNEGLDTYALAPASRGWTRITTRGIRYSVENFFDNLESPGYILNDLLQGKAGQASVQTMRFVVNSTVGIFGLFDPAQAWLGLKGRPEDFGQTLGVWGVDDGPYLVVPVYGPSSGRDITRYPVAYYTNVLTYVTLDTLSFGTLTAVNIVNARAQGERLARFRDESSLDPYIFTRSAYRQYRQNQTYDGNPPQNEDPYGEFFDAMEADN